jgi:1-acyl-sn-glycerol-3-phosphate acyltransferase
MTTTPDQGSHVLALIRAILFVLLTCVLVPIQLVWMVLFSLIRLPKRQSPIVRLWYRLVLKLMCAEVTVVNKSKLRRGQKIFLGNHISYVDILCLGAAFDCFFVAKIDVAGWPVFGFLSKIGGTIFISRARAAVKKQVNVMRRHIQAGQSLFLFPEGTSTNGFEVLPFKSSLLHVMEMPQPPVAQPVTIQYTHLNGRRIDTSVKMDKLAWYGDMTLAPHLWSLFGQKSFKAKITLHQALSLSEEMNVKQLTLAAHEAVKSAF